MVGPLVDDYRGMAFDVLRGTEKRGMMGLVLRSFGPLECRSFGPRGDRKAPGTEWAGSRGLRRGNTGRLDGDRDGGNVKPLGKDKGTARAYADVTGLDEWRGRFRCGGIAVDFVAVPLQFGGNGFSFSLILCYVATGFGD